MATVTLTKNDTKESFDFEIIDCTRGGKAIDFSKLSATTGLFGYDPGYGSTAGAKSHISFVDGARGELLYHGVAIDELISRYKFTDICDFLLSGTLPDPEHALIFDASLRNFAPLDKNIAQMIANLPASTHPMAVLSAAASIMTSLYPNDCDQILARRIIAQTPVIIAHAHKNSLDKKALGPDSRKNFVENFLFMIRDANVVAKNGRIEAEEISSLEVDALDKILTLHADHGQNASTTTVRNVISTGVHFYAGISAGISALWGPSHGGANEKVLLQLQEIADVANVERYIARVKDKNDSFRLMGFGHRVYKNYDPRAKALKKIKDALVKNGVKMEQKLLEIAEKVEERALSDEYFIERNLYPNVDFYSGIILSALKIPISLFTPIFAMGRMPGWCAQLIEHKNDREMRLARPKQVYLGR